MSYTETVKIKIKFPNFDNNIMFKILSWVFKFIKKGMKKEINITDLYTNLEEDSSALLGNKLHE